MPRADTARAPIAGTRVHVALLRGINVGRARRVSMADLSAAIEGLGFGGVRTLLTSGNVVFRSRGSRTADAGPRIERALAGRWGFAVHVTTLTAEELDAVVAEMPFRMTGRDPSRLMVGFFRTPTDERRVDGVLGERAFSRELARGPRVVYIWCPDGLLESRAAQAIAKAAGAGITTRNWSTVVKLARLAQPDAAPR